MCTYIRAKSWKLFRGAEDKKKDSTDKHVDVCNFVVRHMCVIELTLALCRVAYPINEPIDACPPLPPFFSTKNYDDGY